MSYQLVMQRRAQKGLASLPQGDYERVRDATAALAHDPRPTGCKKLIDRDGWRIREGDYRVIYDVDDAKLLVTVLDIGHRRESYR